MIYANEHPVLCKLQRCRACYQQQQQQKILITQEKKKTFSVEFKGVSIQMMLSVQFVNMKNRRVSFGTEWPSRNE